jgi:hypothetical protein
MSWHTDGGSILVAGPYAPGRLGTGSHTTLCCGRFPDWSDLRVTARAREESGAKIADESCCPLARGQLQSRARRIALETPVQKNFRLLQTGTWKEENREKTGNVGWDFRMSAFAGVVQAEFAGKR